MSKRNGISHKLLIFMGLLTLWGSPAWANNLKISNVSLEDRNPTNNTVVVQFDISWDNSWKDSINHDATWVFLKACNSWNGSKCTAAYKHGVLDTAGTNPTGTSYGSNGNVEVYIPYDRKGAFIRRNATGSGTLSSTKVRLVMDYGESGIADTDSIVVKVYGIEMVYVPDGPFYIGDGVSGSESVYAFHKNGVDNTAVQITTSSNDITCDSNANDDIDTTPIAVDGDNGIGSNPSWPNGYPAFYLMKYEVTQGQWRDFLNTLSRAQQNTRTETNVSTDAITNIYAMSNTAAISIRNGIQCPATGNGTIDPIIFGCSFDTDTIYNEFNDGENIAGNYLEIQDLLAYADWAGLRPMTELEYEKAARGTVSAAYVVYGESAWGTTALTQAQGAAVNTVANSGEKGEKASNSGPGIANYDGPGTDVSGPLRSGYAATGSTDRSTAGSGYYGNMELSGNLLERVVTIGNSTGRLFYGSNGDGTLTTTSSYEGNATNTDWPGVDATLVRGVTGATGSGSKGGAYNDTTATYLDTSERTSASTAVSTRQAYTGGRLARTAADSVTPFFKYFDSSNTGDYFYNVIPANDFGFIVSGATKSFGAGGPDEILVRLDDAGNLLWAKTLGGINIDQDTYGLVETSDGSIVVAGTTYSYGGGNEDILLSKFDAAGVEQWSKTLGGANTDIPYKLIGLSDGSLVVIGYTTSYGAGGPDGLISKFDSSGVEQWTKTLGTASGEYFYDGVVTSSGDFIVVGSWNNDCWFSKFNSSGVKQWSYRVTDSYANACYGVAATPDGNFVITGDGLNGGADDDPFLMKITGNGDVLWSKVGTNNAAYDNAHGMDVTADGDIFLMGYQGTTDETLFTKLDGGGNVKWAKSVSTYTISPNGLPKVHSTKDGGLVAGRSYKSGNDNRGLVFRLDKNGKLEGTINGTCSKFPDFTFSMASQAFAVSSIATTETNQSISETNQTLTEASQSASMTNICP